MKIKSSTQSPTATKSPNTVLSKPTAAPAKRAYSTPTFNEGFQISTQKDGAVVVINGAKEPLLTVAPAMPYKSKKGDRPLQTHVLTFISEQDGNGTELNAPRFKITPFIFGTVGFDQVADGRDNFMLPTKIYGGENLTDTIDVKAALRPNNEYLPPDAGPQEKATTTMYMFDSVFTLATAKRPMVTQTSDRWNGYLNDAYTKTQSTSQHASSMQSVLAGTSGVTTPTSSAATLGASASHLSAHAVAGIAAGAGVAALGLAAGASLLYRKFQQRKRQRETEAFSIKLKPLHLVNTGAERA